MQQVTSAQAGTVLGVIGPSGSGKTTLLEFLVTELAARGLRVNVIKHSHHDLELEPPRKDSARFRQAGAADVMVASPFRYAIVHELRGAPEPTLAEQMARLPPGLAWLDLNAPAEVLAWLLSRLEKNLTQG